jgi:ABC-type arginine/histidine transport system permease subunit
MNQNIVLTFALLYSACIALICAVYVALNKHNKNKIVEQEVLTEISETN